MIRKTLLTSMIFGILCVAFSQISCNAVYVKVLPGLPTIKETVRVYGISKYDGDTNPNKIKLTENAGKIDAQVVTATLAKGMRFNYVIKEEGDVVLDQYEQSTWAELHNFEVKNRDLVDAGTEKFLLTTADVSLVYDMDEENYQALKKGVAVETLVSIKPAELISINQVIHIAIKQATKKLYSESTKEFEGSVWVIKVLPKFNVSGKLSKDLNRYLKNEGKYVPKVQNKMEFMVTLVLRKDYIPSNAAFVGTSNSNLTELIGIIETTQEDEFVVPSFAINDGENIEEAREKAKKRADKFVNYIARGFEYKGKGYSPRKDRSKVNLSSYAYSVQSLIAGDNRKLVIGKGIIKPPAFEVPIVKPRKLEVKHSFKISNKKQLDLIFDNLIEMLVVKAIRDYGSVEGMGYFGKQFFWRVFVDQQSKELHLEVSCDIYMHIKPYNK